MGYSLEVVARFLGVDLGWYGKPTGLALIEDGELRALDRIEQATDIRSWIREHAGDGPCVAAVDAPLVIPNAAGIRECERELNRDFRRYDAGCHAANLGLPFAERVIGFSRALEEMGFAHGAAMRARARGRYQIEVHPHAATVALFGLDRIVKYKRGLRADRARGLSQLRSLLLEHLPVRMTLPAVPRTGPLKPVEDQIDAALCAYIAQHYWEHGRARNRVYGSNAAGYIVVPNRDMLP
jgi:predicted RNase H-like nuclease